MTAPVFVQAETRQHIFAEAILSATASFAERAAQPPEQRDPLERLMDPAFSETLWLYEHSHIGQEIPGQLHAKQWEALTNAATHRWLFWGNQVGKTTLGAVDLVLSALGRHPLQLSGVRPMPPFTGWASALSWELWEKILLPELLTWIPRGRIIDAPSPHVHSTKRDIVLLADNGKQSRITGKAAEQGPGKYQSARVHKVWLDEEHPETIYDEMQPRLLRFGGTTLATMTPILGMTWVHGRIYEPAKLGTVPLDRHWYSHAGLNDNPSISPEARAELRAELVNNPSQLAARESGYFVRPVGAVYEFDLQKHGVDLEGQALESYMATAKFYGQLDLGKWRFAFAFGGVGPDGALTMLDEYFSQNESTDVRAKGIHDLLKRYKVKDLTIVGDCAVPTEIEDLNAAFARIDSTYRVWPVAAEYKHRLTGINRVENLLTRGALKVRRGMGAGTMWYEGQNANSTGRPVRGSRWVWEMTHWQYPKAKDGKVQKDDPDDATADGADMMDGLRYLTMTWLGPLAAPKAKRPAVTMYEREQEALKQLDQQRNAVNQANRFGTVLRQ